VRPTFHLVPAEAWAAASGPGSYRAASLAKEGFVHCTDGAANMVATANRHYRDDPREFVVLTLDLDRVGARWTVEDPGGIYPHVFGPIDRAAILAVTPIQRDEDGTFVRLDG
jgi:uncharacterized protein (DUF952 family)